MMYIPTSDSDTFFLGVQANLRYRIRGISSRPLVLVCHVMLSATRVEMNLAAVTSGIAHTVPKYLNIHLEFASVTVVFNCRCHL